MNAITAAAVKVLLFYQARLASWLARRLRRWHTLSWRPKRTALHTMLGDLCVRVHGPPVAYINDRAMALRREGDTWVPIRDDTEML